MKRVGLIVIALLIAMATSAAAFTYQKDYFKDEHDDGVKAIQQRMIELGYLSGKADGWFGDKTQSAIKRFQMVYEMDITGIADQKFQEMLFSDQAKASPKVMMSLDELKKMMSAPSPLGIKFDLSDMIVEKNSATVELNNYVVMHCELLGDDVTEIMLVGKDNVTVPFTMLIAALDPNVELKNMSQVLDMLVEEKERHVKGMTIRYEKDKDNTERLIVTPMEGE